jgi:hypothetical protein
MSTKRLEQAYRQSASSLHKMVGDVLKDSVIFKHAKIYQEYPVNRISRYFDSGREKFDWVILDPFRAIIECHGLQHYKPVRFGGITEEEAASNYKQQVIRDKQKQEAAEKAGYKYIIIRYDEEPTADIILQRIANHEPTYKPVEQAVPESPQRRTYQRSKASRDQWARDSGAHDKQKQLRKQQYERAKQYKLNKTN